MRKLLLSAVTLALSGCAGAIINGVRLGDPDRAELLVDVEAHELYDYRQPNTVVAHYMGYLARSPVPVQGGPQPERFAISLTEWVYAPEVARMMNPKLVEIQYLLETRVIRRQRFPCPLAGPGPIVRAIQRQREAAAAPRPAPAPSPAAQRPTVPKQAPELSTNLDAPTPHDYPRELVAKLDAHSGPRYLRLRQTPNKLVQLTVDVKSHGDPRATAEVTWWSVELLDEKGRPLPQMEKEMVDVGGEFRHIAEWRFDGSPVILKLQSGSDAGDTIRIRFEELE